MDYNQFLRNESRKDECLSIFLVGFIHSTCDGVELATDENQRFEFIRHGSETYPGI